MADTKQNIEAIARAATVAQGDRSTAILTGEIPHEALVVHRAAALAALGKDIVGEGRCKAIGEHIMAIENESGVDALMKLMTK